MTYKNSWSNCFSSCYS